MSSRENNAALVREFFAEAINAHDIDALDQYCSADYLWHTYGATDALGERRGLADYKKVVNEFYVAFPDFSTDLEDVIAGDDRAVVRYIEGGTHSEGFLGFAATHAKVIWSGIGIFRIADGKIVEEWSESSLGHALSTAAAANTAPPSVATLVREFFSEAINGHSTDAFDNYCSADYVWHGGADPGSLGEVRGLGPFKEAVATFFTGFPDLHVEILDLVAAGDRAAVRFRETGTHLGTFVGIGATGKKLEWAGMGIYRAEAGKLCEEWFVDDSRAIFEQLGAIPMLRDSLDVGA